MPVVPPPPSPSGEYENDPLPAGTVATDPRERFQRLSQTPFRLLIVNLLIALVYFGGAKLGLQLATVHPSATFVWPPTGIAFAAVLLFGYRVAPAIFAGAFLANLTTFGTVATSAGIATGNSAEALIAVLLTKRFAGEISVFDRTESLFRFLVLAALSTSVSAAVGVLVLSVSGAVGWNDASAISVTWWLGDFVGIVLVAPPIVLWATGPWSAAVMRSWPATANAPVIVRPTVPELT